MVSLWEREIIPRKKLEKLPYILLITNVFVCLFVSFSVVLFSLPPFLWMLRTFQAVQYHSIFSWHNSPFYIHEVFTMGKVLGLYKHNQNGDVIFMKREEKICGGMID